MSKKILVALSTVALWVSFGPLPAVASSSIDVQVNNPQVAGVANSNSTAVFPTNKQNEPTIAVSPANPNFLIAGSNDEQIEPPCGPGPVRGADAAPNDCSFFPSVSTSGVYTSADGGSTWTNRGVLPGFSNQGGSLVSDGDPVVVYGPKPTNGGGFSFANGARAYYGSLASFASGQTPGATAPELLTVSTSDDNGLSWANPVVAANGKGHIFNDKEAVWADTNPASPFFGRVYVAWTQFPSVAETAQKVKLVFSVDGGQTWSAPNQISSGQKGRGGRQGTALRSGPDGTVYLVWEDSDGAGFKQVVSVSRNGGVTWSRPADVAHIVDIFDAGNDRIPGANFRENSFASVAVDQNNGTVYVAWADGSTSPFRIVVSKSTDGGATWGSPATASNPADGAAFFQGLDVAQNGRVDLAYQAQKAIDPSTYGGGNAAIDSFYVSSSNSGVTWSASVKVSSASSDPAASAQNNLARQFWGDYNTLVSTNATAWFIYTDSRNGATCPAVDAFQHGVDGTGPAATKPAPENVCPGQFGNTNVVVSKITP